MKRLFILGLILTMAINGTMAQDKAEYTLNDIIPGGNNYMNLLPKRMPGLQWWGEVCINADVEEIRTVNAKNGKETVLVTLEEINNAIAQTKPEMGLKPLRHLLNASMPWGEKKVIRLLQSGHVFNYDLTDKKITTIYAIGKGAQNHDFCDATDHVAYTIGNDLYISGASHEEVKVNPDMDECITFDGKTRLDNLVYGQAVHRNEFGIDKGTFWSPQGNALAFYRMDQSMVTDYPQVNTTTRISTLEPEKYPMAGTASHKVTVGIYNLNEKTTIYLKAGDPTDRYFTNISWAPNGKQIYVIELNRDQNHAQIVRYNALTGDKEAVIYEEKHPKYVEPQNVLTFLPWNDNQFIYQSQRDGFKHLYLFDTAISAANGWQTTAHGSTYTEHVKVSQITQGEWLVKGIVGFNPQKKELLISSTEISPLQANIYCVNIKNGTRRLVGEADANHRVMLSAEGKQLIDQCTSVNIPRRISILPTNGKKGVTLLDATDPLKEKYNLPEITLGTLKAADGKTDLYYRLIKPVNFDPAKKYPAVIYVYGGPHAQLITNAPYYGARGWDMYMAQKGYVMLTVDGRGSDNRGQAFENCTFRQLGNEEMKDQIKGAEFLKSLPYVDADRIGVHGWSFGGFMTTNLMLTYSDIFKTGVAGGPVIDWKYYEIMYGERYMDTPQSNPEGYKQADLKNKAGNLKGRLLLIIGGTDPVCVPQHTYTFLRACIDAGSQPDLFVYPEDGHNMMGADRVHLHEKITRYFEDFLK